MSGIVKKLVVGVLGFGFSVLAVETIEDPSHRFSWGPQDFIKGGFRSAPWVRDPFFPEQRKFSLKGIISAELAYVNGRWVREGDRVEGYLVKQITERSVALSKQAEMVLLKLDEEDKETGK